MKAVKLKKSQDSAADEDGDETRQIQEQGAPVSLCRGTNPHPNLSNNLLNTSEEYWHQLPSKTYIQPCYLLLFKVGWHPKVLHCRHLMDCHFNPLWHCHNKYEKTQDENVPEYSWSFVMKITRELTQQFHRNNMWKEHVPQKLIKCCFITQECVLVLILVKCWKTQHFCWVPKLLLTLLLCYENCSCMVTRSETLQS